jgi:hypothetical protein
MSKLEQIESHVAALSPEDLSRFREWFIAFDGDAWDRQIERDLKEGRLDALLEEANDDLKKGRTRAL